MKYGIDILILLIPTSLVPLLLVNFLYKEAMGWTVDREGVEWNMDRVW